MTKGKILRRGGIQVTREDGHAERTRGRYWLHGLPGDVVIRQPEPDRIGRAEALNFGPKCTVRWLDTDTVERDVPMHGLTKIGEAPDETPITWDENLGSGRQRQELLVDRMGSQGHTDGAQR